LFGASVSFGKAEGAVTGFNKGSSLGVIAGGIMEGDCFTAAGMVADTGLWTFLLQPNNIDIASIRKKPMSRRKIYPVPW